jgi:hypothetical protein
MPNDPSDLDALLARDPEAVALAYRLAGIVAAMRSTSRWCVSTFLVAVETAEVRGASLEIRVPRKGLVEAGLAVRGDQPAA